MPAGHRLRPLLLGALTALTVATPLLPSESAASHGTGAVLIMLWLVLLLGWLAVGVWEGRLTVRTGPTVWALLAFAVWYSLSAAVMARYGQPRASWNYLWLWLSLILGGILARQLLRTALECRAIVAVMIALAVGLSVHGYYQYFWSMPATRAAFQRNPEKVLAEAGVQAPPGSPQRKQFEDRLQSTEPIATFTLANSLAGFLSAWLVVTAGVAAAGIPGSSTPFATRQKAFGTAAFTGAVILGCWILTKSRSAWLATLVGVLFLGLGALRQGGRRLRVWHVVMGASLGGVAVAFGVLAGALDRLVITEALKSFSYRIEYWRASWAMIADHRWFGCGPGNFQQCYTRYKLPGASETVTDPHNFLLEIWASGGTPAVVAFLAVLVAFVWQLSRCRRTVSDAPLPSPAPHSVVPPPRRPGSPRPVYWGALAGLLLAYFPAGYLVGQAPDPAFLVFAAPVAAGTLVLWHGWVQNGPLPIWVIVVAIGTLLLNLMAAGGISFPGVAGTLWLLVALALNLAEFDRPPQVVGRGWTAAWTGLAAVLLLCCQRTMYDPVLRGSALVERGLEQLSRGRFQEGEQTLQAAAAIDPWSEQPWQTLAAVRHRQWLQTGSPADLASYQEAAEKMLDTESAVQSRLDATGRVAAGRVPEDRR